MAAAMSKNPSTPADPNAADDTDLVVLAGDDVSDPLVNEELNAEASEPTLTAAPSSTTGEAVTRMHMSPTTAIRRGTDSGATQAIVVNKRLKAAEDGKVVHRLPEGEVLIPGAQEVVLDEYDPWNVREAHKALTSGVSKHEESLRAGSILQLAKKNGTLLYILFAEGVLIVLATLGICWLIFNKQAYAKPAVAQIEFYHKPEAMAPQILPFAQQMAQWFFTWNYQSAVTIPTRCAPYLDPGLRGTFASEFTKETADASQYHEHSICEPLDVRYRGVASESTHSIELFIQVYRGRGEQTSTTKWDAISRMFILMEVAEGEVTSENRLGLYVTRWIPITERQYMASKLGENGNPWDKALGIKKKAKPKAKEEAK